MNLENRIRDILIKQNKCQNEPLEPLWCVHYYFLNLSIYCSFIPTTYLTLICLSIRLICAAVASDSSLPCCGKHIDKQDTKYARETTV